MYVTFGYILSRLKIFIFGGRGEIVKKEQEAKNFTNVGERTNILTYIGGGGQTLLHIRGEQTFFTKGGTNIFTPRIEKN